jgi:hypothetical protein
MPIDTHVRVAAWLHIALGVIAVGVLALVGMFFGVFGAAVGASAQGSDANVLGWIAGLGATLFLFIAAFPALEILGGVMLLNASPVGKVLTIIFSVLGLINIPIGTVVGIYSLWALLREIPQPASSVVTMPAGPTAPY